jgi:hypothetical protein
VSHFDLDIGPVKVSEQAPSLSELTMRPTSTDHCPLLVRHNSFDDVEELEHDRIKLVNALIQSLTFRELSKLYKTNSDRYSLMKTFSTWQSIKNYRDGGVFMDVSSSYTCVYAMLMM